MFRLSLSRSLATAAMCVVLGMVPCGAARSLLQESDGPSSDDPAIVELVKKFVPAYYFHPDVRCRVYCA